MKSVNIAELKDRLSLYLSRVKAGEEIVIRDRDRPIARLVPLRKGDDDDGQLAVLVAKGLIRLGEGPLDDEFWSLPAPRVSAATLQRVISEERHEDDLITCARDGTRFNQPNKFARGPNGF